ncbi:uncharacterized protein N7487_005760, partial [Penicillium crustosum]|uniref:uncharacterized protein n=1 Tax=Penicillium crustosum TaxID=36656 RepID=UPI00239B0455
TAPHEFKATHELERLTAPSFALIPRRVKRGGWNSRLQNQSEKRRVVVILQSRTSNLPRCITASNSQQDTLCRATPLTSVSLPLSISLLLCTDLSFTYSHLLPHTALHFYFSSITLYHPPIAFGLLLFSVLVELGTWYAGRCNLIYHHY